MFSAFLSPRAASATPEERLGALAEHLPETYGLRQLTRGSASSSIPNEATAEFAARCGPWLRGAMSADTAHAGPASAGGLATSRRGPGYPIAQQFIGVGSFHPTRNAPLRTAHGPSESDARPDPKLMTHDPGARTLGPSDPWTSEPLDRWSLGPWDLLPLP